ncbi:hypothetical protein GCM10027051_26000 [Niabella terrae]
MIEQFDIRESADIEPEDSYLAMQLGRYHFSFCIYDPIAQQLLQLKRYHFDFLNTDILDQIMVANPILEGSFDKIMTALDFGISALLPQALSTGDSTPLMYLEQADPQDHVIREYLDDQKITHLYTVPFNILNWMVQHFPSSGFLHAYSVRIKNIKNAGAPGIISIDVQSEAFSCIVVKESTLQLARTYTYGSPEDMVFYLLKIAASFGLSQETVQLEISGLIDADSKLYKAVYDYFLNVTFKQVQWIDRISGLPAHYFTSLNELTICELLQEA